jgi:Glycosyl hydrolases family 35
MRVALLVLLAASTLAVSRPEQTTPQPEFVQAVEFPYYLYPRAQWERELVWMKTIGVRTVEFSIPWNWHQFQPGEFDFTGRTSPRRDLAGFLRILRKLDLHGWARPLPLVKPDPAAQTAWLKQLEALLAPQTAKHGGPIAFVEGHELAIDAAPSPSPVTVIAATDASALARSRAVLASGHGALLWTNVEDELFPAGWEPVPAAAFRRGAVDLNGTERPSAAALRRDAALLDKWQPLLSALKTVAIPPPAANAPRLPRGVAVTELASPPASVVSVVNRNQTPFQGDVRVVEPATRRVTAIPGVKVPAGQALWLPWNLSLGTKGLCKECSFFSGDEHVVYATAELLNVEFENGILAMEFAAPDPGEVVLQLAREPVGPFIAAGKPTDFEWDDKTLRARLTIPAGKAAGNRVRIGLAIEAPETSAFFSETKRLVIGQKNLISTIYSSAEVAARSRLRVPEGFVATPVPKSPNEIDYSIEVPADALHGDWVTLVLEADGVPLGRARLQLFRPASIRLGQAFALHFGTQTALPVEPPIVSADARNGGNVEVVIRNNSPGIQNYRLAAAGEGLEFSPRQTEIAVAGAEERTASLRLFPDEGATGLRDWHLQVTGGATLDLPFRVLLIPRDGAVAWSADLDGDGSPEWVIESQKIRAVFSGNDGGRWMDFLWKDTNTNFLPLEGALARTGPVEVRADGNALHFTGNGWTRTVSLANDALTIEQTPTLPADLFPPPTGGTAPSNVTLSTERQSPGRVVYRIKQSSRSLP